MSVPSIDSASDLFQRGNYQAALQHFLSMRERGDSSAELILSIGKCYFHMTEVVETSVRLPSPPSVRGRHAYVRERISTYTVRNFYNEALAWFDLAIATNKKLASSHFWKGRVLEAQGEVQDAYTAFSTAAGLDPVYLDQCRRIFDRHVYIEGSLVSVPDGSALDLMNSPSAFNRFQGCWKVFRSESPSCQESKRLKELQGTVCCSFYIWYTGDADERVRKLATTALVSG